VGINDYVPSLSRDAEATFLFAGIAGFAAFTEGMVTSRVRDLCR
jgi:hypothetical protein